VVVPVGTSLQENRLTERTLNALNEIETLIKASLYEHFILRLEVLKPNDFVTASMQFHHGTINESQQQLHEYSNALLASFTCDIQMWRDFATRLIDGDFEIAGTTLRTNLEFAEATEQLYFGEAIRNPRKSFSFSHNNPGQLHSSKALVALGQPPFANLADASARYIHEIPVPHNQIPYEKTFIIVLPHQSKIAIVEWIPGELRIRLSSEAYQGHQLDIFYWGQNRVINTKSLSKFESQDILPVLSGTTSIVGHLLGPGGAIVQSFVLQSPYSFIGEEKSAVSLEQEVRADILGGENEGTELKTFFNPDDNSAMRDRVLHSSIAFSNTAGGNIYIGVEDDGGLSGTSKLVKVMKKTPPEESARELSTKMRKYIAENTRPVAAIIASEIKIGEEWVVRLKVDKSDQMITTHMNDVFVRLGASNRKPSSEWLQAHASQVGGLFRNAPF
jgi:hypothetical protein